MLPVGFIPFWQFEPVPRNSAKIVRETVLWAPPHKAWSLGGSVIRGHMANGQARVSGSWRWGWTFKVVHRALFHSSTIGSFLPEQRCDSMTSHSTQIKPRQRKKKWFLYLYFVPILLAHLSYRLLSSSMYLCCVTFFPPSLATVFVHSLWIRRKEGKLDSARSK